MATEHPQPVPAASPLLTALLGSSDASEAHAATLAQYDAQIRHLDRLIAVAELMRTAESNEDLSGFDLPGPKCSDPSRALPLASRLTATELDALEAQVASL